jgi:2,6-dihydroxypseudooxynicotine hydrolase
VDTRLASAIAHWAPRFTANGVAPPDFEAITSPLERWEQWPDAWSAGAAVHEGLGRAALDEGRSLSAGAHLARAAVYYHFAKFVYVEDLDRMAEAHRKAVECLDDALAHLDPPGERHEIPFEGSRLVGILRRPRGVDRPPLVIMLSGLDSAKEELRSTEELFLQRGLATFAVDGPGQGEAEYDLAIRGDWEVVGRALVGYLSGLDGIDPERLGVWGVSLGGYYAPRLASGTPEIRACIGLAGPFNFGAIWDDLPVLTRETFVVRSKSSSDDEGRAKALELSMEGRAGAISCPVQLVAGRRDRIIPWTHAERLAAEIGPRCELLLLDDGNHGCANVSYKHRYTSADWMARTLSS